MAFADEGWRKEKKKYPAAARWKRNGA